jgi:SOS-response transcriptional repressor LexA
MTGTERLPLTHRQTAILAFIKDHVRDRGFPPSIREIGDETGIRSPNGVMCHMKALMSKGYIAHDPLLSRGWRVIDAPETQTEKVARLRRELKDLKVRLAEAIAEGEGGDSE